MASPAWRRYGSACSAWPTSLPDWTTPGKSRRCEMCAIGCFQAFQQRLGLCNIGFLATREQPTHWATERIDNDVNLARPSTTRTAYCLCPLFFLAPAAC